MPFAPTMRPGFQAGRRRRISQQRPVDAGGQALGQLAELLIEPTLDLGRGRSLRCPSWAVSSRRARRSPRVRDRRRHRRRSPDRQRVSIALSTPRTIRGLSLSAGRHFRSDAAPGDAAPAPHLKSGPGGRGEPPPVAHQSSNRCRCPLRCPRCSCCCINRGRHPLEKSRALFDRILREAGKDPKGGGGWRRSITAPPAAASLAPGACVHQEGSGASHGASSALNGTRSIPGSNEGRAMKWASIAITIRHHAP